MERQPFRYSDNEGTFFTGMLQIALGVFIGALAALFAYEAISAYRMKLAAQDAAKEMKAAADRQNAAAAQARSRASWASSSATASGLPRPRRYRHRRGMKWSYRRMKAARSRARATDSMSAVQSCASRVRGVGVDTGDAARRGRGLLMKSVGMVCQVPVRA